jgi:hypothetical protein
MGTQPQHKRLPNAPTPCPRTRRFTRRRPSSIAGWASAVGRRLGQWPGAAKHSDRCLTSHESTHGSKRAAATRHERGPLRTARTPSAVPVTVIGTHTTALAATQPMAPAALAARRPRGRTPRWAPPHAAAPQGAPRASAVWKAATPPSHAAKAVLDPCLTRPSIAFRLATSPCPTTPVVGAR